MLQMMMLVVYIFLNEEQASRGKEKVYSVCEILEHLPRLQQQTITVEGRWVRHETGKYLLNLEKRRCAKPLVTEGFEWPAQLSLRESKSIDEAALLEIYQLGTSHLNEPEVPVRVTGQLIVRLPLQIVKANGVILPAGFGHLNGSPAELVYVRLAARPRR